MPDNPRMAKGLSEFLTSPDVFTLPEMMKADEASDEVITLFKQSGGVGATFSLRFGDMTGQHLYAVSVYPERTRKSAGGTVNIRFLHLFIEENLDLLADPRCSVGLWYNADEGVTYRDIVVTLPSRQEAIALASRYDQIAIFDLQALIETATGGTGNTPTDLTPATERLPEIGIQNEEEL